MSFISQFYRDWLYRDRLRPGKRWLHSEITYFFLICDFVIEYVKKAYNRLYWVFQYHIYIDFIKNLRVAKSHDEPLKLVALSSFALWTKLSSKHNLYCLQGYFRLVLYSSLIPSNYFARQSKIHRKGLIF